MTLIKGEELLLYFVPNKFYNPNVVSVHQQQAQLLRGAGCEVGSVVCPSAACNETLLNIFMYFNLNYVIPYIPDQVLCNV